MKSLFLLLFLFSSQVSFADTCHTPKPFAKVSQDKTQQYDFLSITKALQKSDTPEPTPEPTQETNAEKTPIKLLNFWASWCAPCRDELWLLDEISTDATVTVQLINIDDKPQQAESVLKELSIKNLSSLYANSELLSELSLMGLPATIVWAPQNQVFIGVGQLKNKAELTNWLACLNTATP